MHFFVCDVVARLCVLIAAGGCFFVWLLVVVGVCRLTLGEPLMAGCLIGGTCDCFTLCVVMVFPRRMCGHMVI